MWIKLKIEPRKDEYGITQFYSVLVKREDGLKMSIGLPKTYDEALEIKNNYKLENII